MASLGQYQSFALIAYDALRIQNDKMCCLRDNGENVSEEVRLLFIARYMIDIVLYYSTGNLGVATPGYKAYTDIIGTPVTAVNAYGNWSGTITVFDASLTIVLTLSVPADILGNKDAVVDLWNSTHGDTGWIMSYEVVQYTMLPQNQSFRYVMSSPKGYTDYTGYSFEYIQYEGGNDPGTTGSSDFDTTLLNPLLPSLGRFNISTIVSPISTIYQDVSYITYNNTQDLCGNVNATTDFDFQDAGSFIAVTAPVNSFDYYNLATFIVNYYIDPNAPPSPSDFFIAFAFTTPGVAPTQETYSGSFAKSPSYPEQTEGEIISVCNWISNNLRFFTEPIPQLDSTTLNG